jgi:hypothetical protein
MPYSTLLERCSSSSLAPYDKECIALQERIAAAGRITFGLKAIRVDGSSDNFPTDTFGVRCENPNLIRSFPAITAQSRAGLSQVANHLEGIANQHGLAIRIQ